MKKIKYILVLITEAVLHVFYIFPIKKNRIFFISHNGTQYSCNPKYIYECLLNNHNLNYDYVWCLNKKDLMNEKTKAVKYKSLMFYYYILTSKVIISNDLISSNLPIRKKQKYIETWHGGGAYKKTGKDVYSSDYEKKSVKKISDKMTHFISSSSFVSKTKSEGYYIEPHKLLETGMPRNDIFFKANDTAKENVYNYFKLDKDTKIVLYAPTFRRNSSYNPLLALDIQALLAKLKEKYPGNWCLIYRLHRIINNENLTYTNVYDARNYPDVQELLVAADILVTDFSSIMWDFSLQYKPIFCFIPDIENFKKDDFFTPIEEWPGIISYSNEMLHKNITDFDEKEYLKKVKEHHRKHNCFDVGTAGESILKLIIEYIEEKR